MDTFALVRKHGATYAQNVFNGAFYQSETVLRSDPQEGLDAQEIVTLLKYQAHVVGRDVLDIGVGSGRTARVLAVLARCYVAIDYSPLVVAEARKTMPHLEVHLEDMRDLARWEDGTLDFVFGPNNVLDAVSHEDRLKTLGEARRVLRDGGLLVFTSHNRCYFAAEAGPRLRVSRNPVTFVYQLVRYLRSVRLHRRMKPMRRFEEEYAVLDDCGPDHALLHYFIDRTAQERQLESAGFELVEVLDKQGGTVARGEMSPESSCLMYVARKRSGG
ncbi:MAG TPA: class I SAM-dependent methyltransferase [Polyangia bacterium]|nr:class I SAM-dependent methyltransferase [Polyangia bacterium]